MPRSILCKARSGKRSSWPGKSVQAFAINGLGDKLAIASTAYRRDVDIALEIIGLTDLFPDNTIITREQFTCAITTRVDRQTFEVMDTPPDLIACSYSEFKSLLGLQSNQ